MRHIILAQSECTAAALSAWLGLLGEKELGQNDEARIVWRDSGVGGEKWVQAYETLVKRIENTAKMDDGSIALNEVVLLVDAVNPGQLSAITDGGGWDNLIAMLILTFPEIKWVFGVVQNKACRFFKAEHSLAALLLRQRRDPLLDPTGMREFVKLRTARKEPSGSTPGMVLPKRRLRACAIDEEKSYSYFHAYTAWRYGFRADAVSSWALMTQQFGPEAAHGYSVLLEDMSLNFPDKPNNTHVSKLGKRGAVFKGLDSTKDSENSTDRILVTTGHDQQGGEGLRVNREYLKNKKRGRGMVVFKPAGGMLDLWDEAGLFRHLRGKSRRGNAGGFIWPPLPENSRAVTPEEGGHSAPGKLMLIAETLLRRAETFRDSACTVKDFIKGAVLATEAAELLGGRTPTLTLAALALKHEYEVKAECAFVGVGYHFDVKGRCKEIEAEVRAVAHWFSTRTRRFAELDARVVILNRLAVVFREAGQFEEEQDCMVLVRRFHRELQLSGRTEPVETLLRWPIHQVLRYAEWLLESFPRFVGMILVWLLGITLAWRATITSGEWKPAFSGAVGSFFGGNPAAVSEGEVEWKLLMLSAVAVVAGVFHVGVFVSYLFSLVTRK